MARWNPFAHEVDSIPTAPQLRVYDNVAEDAFRYHFTLRGWTVTKRGWPDFFCRDETGRIVVVEVKRRGYHLTSDQVDVLDALTAHGFPCFVAIVDASGWHGSLQRYDRRRHA